MKDEIKQFAKDLSNVLVPKFAALVTSYEWPYGVLTLDAEKTVILRADWHKKWVDAVIDDSRVDIVADIRAWAKTNRGAGSKDPENNPSTLERVIPALCRGNEPRDVIEQNCTGSGTRNWGMTTWTSILTVANPDSYFIFDSPVSCGLNKLCCELDKPVVDYCFPELPSESEPRHACQVAAIEALKKRKAVCPSSCVSLYFDLYCPLMLVLTEELASKAAELQLFGQNQLDPGVREQNKKKFGFDLLPHFVEMALFMKGK